ncbi:hypothetical protein DL96DRAFT_1795719 [Flagelloscypha sp. PMI_526]|nr:hypothetical protein DL96DRAFT_1795719 [Flagelloscypha sp. PMI_526]
MKLPHSCFRISNLTFLFNFFALFISSSQALTVDWTADKAPTHTLDHVTGILKGGSGDLAKVNVQLVLHNIQTGETRAITIANNVASQGSYTIQVPNQYIGDPTAGETVEDYFARDLRYNVRATNPSNGVSVGLSDEFVIFWSPSDGTPTPTKMADEQVSSSSSGSSNSGSSNSGSTSSNTSNSSSGSNKGDDSSLSASSSSTTAVQSSSSSSTSLKGLSTSLSPSGVTNVSTSTAPAVTVPGAVVVSGSTATVTTITGGLSTTQSGKSNMTGAIVGAIVGGLVLLALLGFLAIWCCRRRRIRNRPTVGEAFTSPQRLPEAGVITPAFWNDEERAVATNRTHGVSAGLDEKRPSQENAYPTLHRLSGITLSGDDNHREKGVEESLVDATSSYSPATDNRYQSSFLAATGAPSTAGAISSTGGHEGMLLSTELGSSTMISNSTMASWWTVGQGSTTLPHSPPPQYSGRDSVRRSTGTIDGVRANLA